MRWAGHVARRGEGRGVHRVLVGRPEGKRPLGRPRRRLEDNINTLRTGDANLRFCITTVKVEWRKSAFLTRAWFPRTSLHNTWSVSPNGPPEEDDHQCNSYSFTTIGRIIHSFVRSFIIPSFIHLSIHSFVCYVKLGESSVVTSLWSWTILDPNSVRQKKYFPNLKRPHWLCGSLSIQFSAYRGTLSGVKAAVPWSLPLTSMHCHIYAVTDRSGATLLSTLIRYLFNGSLDTSVYMTWDKRVLSW
jgi:hypothetical protein